MASFMHLADAGCRFPTGETAGGYLFCDAPRVHRKSYCVDHCAVALIPVTPASVEALSAMVERLSGRGRRRSFDPDLIAALNITVRQ